MEEDRDLGAITPRRGTRREGKARLGVFCMVSNPYPDGSDRWVARYRIGLHPLQYARKEFATKKEADWDLLMHGSDLNNEFRPDVGLAAMLEWFILHLPANLDRRTVEEHRCVVRLHLVDYLGPERAIGTLDKADYASVYDAMIKRGLDERKTVYTYMCIIARFSARACADRFSDIEPVRAMLGDIWMGQDFRQYDPVPDTDLKLIRAACNPQTRFMFPLLWSKGVRPAAMQRARRRDLDLRDGVMFIRHAPIPGWEDEDHRITEGHYIQLDGQLLGDACRWMSLTAGKADDPLFPERFACEILFQLNAAQREAGLLRVCAAGSVTGLWEIENFIETAARNAAKAGKQLKQITSEMGLLDTRSMERRIGFIIDAEAARQRHRKAIETGRYGERAA
ncbi:MAG: hypothetical protein WBA73_16455 [Devosia sp.]